MTKASKLIMKKIRCEALWATGPSHLRCTQVAKYEINLTFYCTTHAKIEALKEVLRA
jgi:hypothetical protein